MMTNVFLHENQGVLNIQHANNDMPVNFSFKVMTRPDDLKNNFNSDPRIVPLLDQFVLCLFPLEVQSTTSLGALNFKAQPLRNDK